MLARVVLESTTTDEKRSLHLFAERPHRNVRLPSAIPLLSALIAAATVAVGSGSPVAAASYTLSVSSPVPVHIGVDAIGGGAADGYDITPCQLGGSGNGPISFSVPGSPNQVRVEMYPGVCGFYDGWSDVGGVHFEASISGGDLGAIQMPVNGQNGAFALRAPILSSTPITEGRVLVDTFQIPTGYPDPPAPLQNNGRVDYGAFASTKSRGTTWNGGIG